MEADKRRQAIEAKAFDLWAADGRPDGRDFEFWCLAEEAIENGDDMSVQVRRRRESAAFLATFVGAQGELLVDTTNNRVQVHDGVTPGGFAAARLGEVVTNARTAVNDGDYAALAADRTIAFTALSAARTVTLPPAAAFATGTRLAVIDESGGCSPKAGITIAAAGSDTINGLPAVAIVTPYGALALQSSGVGRWTITDQTAVPNRRTFADVALSYGSRNQTIYGNFTRLQFTAVNQDAGSNWSAADNWYTCPRAGIYAITGTVRADGLSAGQTLTCGVFTAEQDGPWHLWTAGSGASRTTYAYSRLSYQNAGDQLRMFSYSDAAGGTTIQSAGLQICLVSDAV